MAVSQQITGRIENAVNRLQIDKQFEHAIIGLYIIDSKTGNVIYNKNGDVGLAPASCQKIITSASAFELLGKDYIYKTDLGYEGSIENKRVNHCVYLTGYGDPTFGSWRWNETNETFITRTIIEELKKRQIEAADIFEVDNSKWGTQPIPDGWVWQDIGNYYGAGSSAFNWHEDQYDVILQPGIKTGDSVKMLSVAPMGIDKVVNELKTAAMGSGDQAYVYWAPYSKITFLRGTIPVGTEPFKISASADGADLFLTSISPEMLTAGISISKYKNGLKESIMGRGDHDIKVKEKLYTFNSPPLDSINYWFLKKSINLYGEAFVKTIAFEKTKIASTDTGINIIKNFWSTKGIEKSAIKIIDGSGLSPANRVTTVALVSILQYAKQRPWFSSFYYALPDINGIKMKDGYIGGVRSYAGYVTSGTGIQYSFAFIVNNFDGNPAAVREKMWDVLNVLK